MVDMVCSFVIRSSFTFVCVLVAIPGEDIIRSTAIGTVAQVSAFLDCQYIWLSF